MEPWTRKCEDAARLRGRFGGRRGCLAQQECDANIVVVDVHCLTCERSPCAALTLSGGGLDGGRRHSRCSPGGKMRRDGERSEKRQMLRRRCRRRRQPAVRAAAEANAEAGARRHSLAGCGSAVQTRSRRGFSPISSCALLPLAAHWLCGPVTLGNRARARLPTFSILFLLPASIVPLSHTRRAPPPRAPLSTIRLSAALCRTTLPRSPSTRPASEIPGPPTLTPTRLRAAASTFADSR